jgi:hypothetical protein
LTVRLRMAGFRGQGGEAVFLLCRLLTPLGLALLTFLALGLHSWYCRLLEVRIEDRLAGRAPAPRGYLGESDIVH